MPTPPSSRRRVSAPKQARSRETYDRFLDATEALLVEHPYEEVTIAEIVRRAERGNGSFYSRFGDKDGVLLALTDRNWERDRSFLRSHFQPSRWAEQLLGQVVREATRLMLISYRVPRLPLKPALLRSAEDEEFRIRRVAQVDEIRALWRDLVLSKCDEIAHPDPEWALTRGLRHTLGVLDHLLVFGPFWSIDHADDEELVEDLVDVQMRLFAARAATAVGGGEAG
jgi:AcrR family transcriptional regulator